MDTGTHHKITRNRTIRKPFPLQKSLVSCAVFKYIMKCLRYTKRYKKYYPVTQVPTTLLKKSKLINIAEVPWSPSPAHHSNLTSTPKWNYYPELGVYHSHAFLHTSLYTLVPQ